MTFAALASHIIYPRLSEVHHVLYVASCAIFQHLKKALAADVPAPEFAYLSADEKTSIRNILKETLTGLPENWQ